ncbi:hypothetical protein C4580_06195 [Candidatus Woesearchaeota archaeon]|nr:MAG: hypothetical protein C4580_06195 [Candidatus Woesearchaeota archaeon]
MESKKIMLALHPGLYSLLQERANKRFMNVQQLIYETLQKEFVTRKEPAGATGKVGRPKKNEDAFLDMFSRKR